MNRRDLIVLGAAGLSASGGPAGAAASRADARREPGWTSLFNGRDLEGWYSVLSRSGKGPPDRDGLVRVENGMIHVLGSYDLNGQPDVGYISTEREFENIHLRVEYKWGERRYYPRQFAKRDNGILYGLAGADEVWPLSVELQIQETDTGDGATVGGARGVQDPAPAGLAGSGLTLNGWGMPAGMSPQPRLVGVNPPPPDPNRAANDRNSIVKPKRGDFEKRGEWNTVELIWQGDRAAHIVNGVCVNVISNLERPDPANPGRYLPLTRGRLAFQVEWAETWFRKIEVRSLG